MKSYTDASFTIKTDFIKWIDSKKYHFIGWAFFITYEVLIIGLFSGHFGTLSSYIIHYILNIWLFYFNAHIVLINSLKNRKQAIWRIPILFLFQTAIYLLCIYYIEIFMIKYKQVTDPGKLELNYNYVIGPLFRCFYFIFFSVGYFFLINFLKERKKTEELEKQRLQNLIQITKSENAFLKAQINPHFLFNTLDFIYHNTIKSSPVAAESILSLANMMRYAVDSNSDDELITLGDEIDQVENLINLHQLRQNHSLQIHFDYEDEIRSQKIIPLVLITLVENIFKHGDLNDQSQPAEINLELGPDVLILKTDNLVSATQNSNGLNSGMENIRKRLNYTYGDRASFKFYKDERNHFIVTLKIKAISEIKYK
ncbi:sensor histidine kinase [Pedobacter punctiformis]|uniref:Histidine kinase n=1 Tax=Pedobacter punctiformis TaxID=3004097 RepID=A0ABT4L7P8_9SPHI|nr:histidine kinase [Pedobacter sp. HCMS5-2]MCZ4243925.1 histidine kinase [Pedobacter sp. HCMS5-2]